MLGINQAFWITCKSGYYVDDVGRRLNGALTFIASRSLSFGTLCSDDNFWIWVASLREACRKCMLRRLVMLRDNFWELPVTGAGEHSVEPVRNLSKSNIKTSTNWKMGPAHIAFALSRSTQPNRRLDRVIGRPVKRISRITCRPNSRVHNSLKPSILDSGASCRRRDRQRN